MSYSFSVKGATKSAVMDEVNKQFDAVIASQPIHACDRAAAVGMVETFLDLLPVPDPMQVVNANVSGSVGWNSSGGVTEIGEVLLTSAGVSVNVYLT